LNFEKVRCMEERREKANQLLLELVKAKDENAVDSILSNNQYVKTLKWWPFNGDKSNFSHINNQQSDPVNALTEKIINSIDALLLKECKAAGIDPESKAAPLTMKEAVERFFAIKDGDLSILDDEKRRELAEKIQVIAEGALDNPNIIIADSGEGQNPKDFKSTLLALSKGNKLKIQFVQGKYGMGGTGVMPFCGSAQKNYMLILSRKYPKLLKSDQEDLWGFTLVRKAPDEHLDPSDKHGYWECLVDENEEVLAFPGIKLPILPYGAELEYGCYVKLFNYDLQYTSYISLDLWRALNRRLYAPVLPILIYETRPFPGLVKGKNDTKIMQGNKFRILKDERDYINMSFQINAKMGAFGMRKIDVVVFKDIDKEGNRQHKKGEWTTSDEEVFLTVNGQTFNTLPRYWLAQNTGLEPLADYLLVHTDCSDVNRNVADPIFLGSKDRVRNNRDYREFKNTLATILKENNVLRKLNEEYRRHELARLIPDKSIAVKLIQNLIARNKTLAEYFGIGQDVPIDEEGDETKVNFEGKHIPTFLKIAKKYTGTIMVKEVPVNSHSIVLLLTDAVDDYLVREKEHGELIIEPIGGKFDVYAWYLKGGLLPIWVKNKGATVGEEEEIVVKLTRPGQGALEVKFKLKAIEPTTKTHTGQPRENKEKGVALPKLVIVRQTKQNEEEKSWADFDPNWNESNIAKVSKGVAVYVNMESADLKNFVATCPKSIVGHAETLYKIGIYLNAILLDVELDKKQITDKNIVFDISLGAISKTILPMYFDKKVQQAIESAASTNAS